MNHIFSIDVAVRMTDKTDSFNYLATVNRIVILFLFIVLTSCSSVHTAPVKIDEYLYEINYSKYDYEKIAKITDFLFYEKGKIPSAACSAIRNGNLMGRNFDWFYDRMPEFVIHVEEADGRFASIGVASPIGMLKIDQLNSITGKMVMDILPALTVDGINSNGVACCVNVVPAGDAGYTIGTNPSGKKLCAGILVRYILDNAKSARDAIDLISARNIYSTYAHGLNEEYHFMIADKDETYVIEFIDNAINVITDGKIMTNFYLSKGVTEHANGLERYDILKEHYNEGVTIEGMENLLRRVWYSKSYSRTNNPLWYSEWCIALEDGPVIDDIEKNPSKIQAAFDSNVLLFESRNRDTRDILKKSWHSVHSSVYDLERNTLNVSSQETGMPHVFHMNGDYEKNE